MPGNCKDPNERRVSLFFDALISGYQDARAILSRDHPPSLSRNPSWVDTCPRDTRFLWPPKSHRLNLPHQAVEVNITVSDLALKGGDKDGSAAWLMYGIARAGWMDKKNGRSEKFSKAYPGETVYRHSLAEELDALNLVSESVSVQMKEKKVTQLNPSLANLLKLKDAGLLEAYVLFARPDEGIARDYAAYRNAHRDKLKRYWLEVVIAGK